MSEGAEKQAGKVFRVPGISGYVGTPVYTTSEQ